MAEGFVSSIQTLGTLDGPGVRFTVFVQGCNLRCGCCHNPETWNLSGGIKYTALEIAQKAERYKEYFGTLGGITLSGGEPLLQPLFAKEIFELCKDKGINTCLDTSGSVLNEDVQKLLDVTDYCLLDIKYTNDEQYKEYAGCSIEKPLEFLKVLAQKEIPTVVRQVIIPTFNDSEQNIIKLKSLVVKYSNIVKIELLPFKKMCEVKYEKLNQPFRFANIPEPTKEKMQVLNDLLKK
jgi:pyruvate formate lyase activating enzyme